MENLRIISKPKTVHSDFELVYVRNDKHSPNKNTDRVGDCLFFVEENSYSTIRTSKQFEDYMRIGCFGFVVGVARSNEVLKIITNIDYTKHSHRAMNGSCKLAKSDIIKAYEDYKALHID